MTTSAHTHTPTRRIWYFGNSPKIRVLQSIFHAASMTKLAKEAATSGKLNPLDPKKTACVEHTIDSSWTTRFWTWNVDSEYKTAEVLSHVAFCGIFQAMRWNILIKAAEKLKPLGESSMMDRPTAKEVTPKIWKIEAMNAPAHCMPKCNHFDAATTENWRRYDYRIFDDVQRCSETAATEFRMLQWRGLVETAAT